MAKRTGSSVRHDRAVRRTEKSSVRYSAAMEGAKKKRPLPAGNTPVRPKRDVRESRPRDVRDSVAREAKTLRRTPERSTQNTTRPLRDDRAATKSVSMGPQAAPNPGAPRAPGQTGTPRAKERSRPARKIASSVRNAPAPSNSHPSAQLPPPRIPTPPPPLVPRSMELEWGCDPGGSVPPVESSFDRWVKRGDALLRQLAQHGAADHEYRVSLRDRRFTWVDRAGNVSAEARAQLLCTYAPQTSCVTMGWADPRTRGFALRAIPGVPSEVDDVDEEAAWHIAMAAADHAGAEYLYRVRSPVCCTFLGLSALCFAPGKPSYVPCTPVTLVLSTLVEARAAADLGAEPVDTLRARLCAAGAALLEQAEYTHRDTDWVARLVRTGRRLGALAERLPRPTFFSVAKGSDTLWLDRRLANDLVESLVLLEDEWRQFA